MHFFLRHLELCLTLIGLAVIVGVLCVLEPTNGSSWRTIAGVATAVFVGQGLVAWSARQHRRKQREAALFTTQALLTRIVDQENAIAVCMAARCEMNTATTKVACADIARLVTAISDELQVISSGSLSPQRANYLDSDALTLDGAPSD